MRCIYCCLLIFFYELIIVGLKMNGVFVKQRTFFTRIIVTSCSKFVVQLKP